MLKNTSQQENSNSKRSASSVQVKQNANGTGTLVFPPLYLLHIAGNFGGRELSLLHSNATFRESFQDKESVWAAIRKSFICKMLYFSQFANVFTGKSFQLLNGQSLLGCDQVHLPRPQITWIVNSSENSDALASLVHCCESNKED